MATVRVISILDPAALLQRATDGLFPLAAPSEAQPWPTLSAWIVLRQGGLRDDLHRFAASQNVAGWFDPPICLFNEIGDRWRLTESLPTVTEPERIAILSGIVEKFGSPVFTRSSGTEPWVPAIDRLMGELVSEGISAEAFAAALKSAAVGAFATDRAGVLARIYAEWLAALAKAQRADGRDTKVRLALDIAAHPDRLAARLGGRRDVRFVGLADLRGGWRHLLGALSASPAVDRVEILTSTQLELPAHLHAEHVAPDAAPTFAGTLFTDGACAAPAVKLVEAPDAAREVELIAVRVRKLLDDGVHPTRIAVAARQARPLVNEMSAALIRLGVPVTVRHRTGLAHTAPAHALRAMLTAAAEAWSRHSIVELAENPLLATGVSPAVANFVGYSKQMKSRDDWRNGFAALHERCVKRENGDDAGEEHRKPLPATDAVRATIAAWDALAPRLAQLDAPRPLAEWFTWVHRTLTDGAWGISAALEVPLADSDVWQADVRARDQIASYALAWNDALSTFGADATPMDAAMFAGRLQLLLEQDLITPPLTDFGVVVAEALAAGWRAFDHVFVVGLSSGTFPQRPGAGGILDDDDRRALIAAGLPLDAPDAWRGRERELFRVVCAAPRTALTLSWPVMDAGGRDTARSAFVDEAAAVLARAHGVEDNDEALEKAHVLERVPTYEALVPGFPVARDAQVIALARAAAEREKGRSKDPSAWNGLIEEATLRAWLAEKYGETFVWSATQLEQAAKCRWHWFAQRLLRLDPQADADDLMEPTVRGSIVHDALDRFFVAARTKLGKPVFLLEAEHGSWVDDLMIASLDAAWAAAAARGEWLGPESLRDVARTEVLADLSGYIAWEMQYNLDSFNARTGAAKQIRMGAAEGEFRIPSVRLEGGGVTFQLHGTIDRIDTGVDDRFPEAGHYIAAIDYKSTKYATPAAGKPAGWADGVVLQVPLYAAALMELRPNDLISRMEYRTIRSPKIVHQLSLAPVKAKAIQEATEAEEKLRLALAAAGARVAEIRDGAFPAAPTRSCGCSPYCPARDICRVPGGPVEVR